MKKLTFVVFKNDYEHFLRSLQNLGVLHIQQAADQTMAEPAELQKARTELADVKRVLAELAKLGDADLDLMPLTGDAHKAEGMTERYDWIKQEMLTLTATENTVQNAVESLKPWGQFDRKVFDALHELGVQEYYYSMSISKFEKEFKVRYGDTEVSRDKKNVYFLAFSMDGNEPEGLAGEYLPKQLPDCTLQEAQTSLNDVKKRQLDMNAELDEMATARLIDLKALEARLTDDIALLEAQLQTTNIMDAAMVLEGWFPTNVEDKVTSFLKGADAYYETRLPVQTDNVPVKMRNNRFNRMFEGLTKMYGVPSYNEWDPTPVVAPFFTLFFAICMGDAGYGLFITLYGLLAMAGKDRKVPILGDMLHGYGAMVTALGVATTVVGLILGSAFGISFQNIEGLTPALHNYYAFVGGNFPGLSYSFQMVAAIIIGVAHLCLAMLVKAVLYTKKEGLRSQISQWAWCLLLIGGIITGVIYMLGAMSEQVALYTLIGIGAVSALGIYILNDIGRMEKSPLKGLLINPLAGLYDTYNMASGLMGDVLSYVRLYALCLAGGALGGAFNQIGDMFWEKGIIGIIIACLVYSVGHALNLLLSAISAFVHPLRLNFVEYFKNSGYEGKGTEYAPLKKAVSHESL